jgi:hypothetical protein
LTPRSVRWGLEVLQMEAYGRRYSLRQLRFFRVDSSGPPPETVLCSLRRLDNGDSAVPAALVLATVVVEVEEER